MVETRNYYLRYQIVKIVKVAYLCRTLIVWWRSQALNLNTISAINSSGFLEISRKRCQMSHWQYIHKLQETHLKEKNKPNMSNTDKIDRILFGNEAGLSDLWASFPSLTRLTNGPPELPYCKKTNTAVRYENKPDINFRIDVCINCVFVVSLHILTYFTFYISSMLHCLDRLFIVSQ